MIAVQLGNYTPVQALNLVVDRDALDRHLGDGVVLLIDELNNLGVPLDTDARQLLREMFLDKAGRYLAFTSHFPVSVDADDSVARGFLGRVWNDRPNFRGVLNVDMSLASSLSELRGMSVACEALTEDSAAWLGYIPSLVFCTMAYSKVRAIASSK
mmetsp:Transcript_11189/g.15421  ORF Transcript_11189/g.15421 Transcript_11189/m.15421 type:complete len:156 (+) Transcript_11189:432-899(+)